MFGHFSKQRIIYYHNGYVQCKLYVVLIKMIIYKQNGNRYCINLKNIYVKIEHT